MHLFDIRSANNTLAVIS